MDAKNRPFKPLTLGFLMVVTVTAWSQPTVLFETGFEPDEGYLPQRELIGQQGWVGIGIDGNGVDSFDDFGQAGWVGFLPPQENATFVSVWQPLNFDPIAENQTRARFAVRMEIVDSSEGQSFNSFRWAAYNLEEKLLFEIDFDNQDLQVYFTNNGGESFTNTGFSFDHGGFYDLAIDMDFARNRQTTTLNEVVVIKEAPITTTQVALNLSDISAVWFIGEGESPGDNFMLFDDIRITAETEAAAPPRIETVLDETEKVPIIRVNGRPGMQYDLQFSFDLKEWHFLTRITVPQAGVFDYLDLSVKDERMRFYRLRHDVPQE